MLARRLTLLTLLTLGTLGAQCVPRYDPILGRMTCTPSPFPGVASDGSGGLTVSGVVTEDQNFTGVRTISGCPVWPANSIFHTDISQAPADLFATQYIIGKKYTLTNATWSGGVATLTVEDTSGLTVGTKGWITRVNGWESGYPSGWNTGYGCNSTSTATGSCIDLGGSLDPRVTITGLTGTTITYALAGDPGAWPGGGAFVTGPYANSRLTMTPDFTLNTKLSTDPSFQLARLNADNTLTPFSAFGILNSDNANYVLDNSMAIENGTIGTGPYWPASDAHVFTLFTDTCRLQEIYGLQGAGPPFYAQNGVEWNLRSNQTRSAKYFCPDCTSGFDGADAAGLPIYPLALTRGMIYGSTPIDTVLRMTLRTTQGVFVAPAKHEASSNQNTFFPGMGTWFRLRASYDISGFPDGTGGTPNIQKVLIGLKTHGMILADNGLSGALTSTDDYTAQEESDVVSSLHNVLMEDFDVVNIGTIMASPLLSYTSAPFTPVAQSDYVLVSLTSSPGGRTLDIDGGTCVDPCQFWWASGASHTIGVSTQTVGNIQYTFASWSDSGAASHSVSPTVNTTYTATFNLTYTVPSDPAFSPPASSVVSGSSVTMSTIPSSCDAYIYWTDDGSTPTTGSNHSTSAVVSAAVTLKAKVIGCPNAVSGDSGVASSAYTLVFQDTFSGTGALSGNWTNVPALAVASGTVVQNSGVAQVSAASKGGAAIVTGQAFTPAQFAEFTISTISGTSTSLGPMVLMDSLGNGYLAVINVAGNSALWRSTSGAFTQIKSGCGAFVVSDVVRLASTAAGVLTLYKNGVQVCTVTDTTWTSGSPGVRMIVGTTVTDIQISTFNAGNN